MIRIKQATKQGWVGCCEGGVADLSYPNSKTRRGRVEEGGTICPTITTTGGLYKIDKVVIQKCGDRDKDGNYSVHDYSNCIPSNPMSDRGQLLMSEENKRYRIRKLTPREAWVLMGLTIEDCDKASAVEVSNSQLYKQAGNGIVSNCVELLFEHLYKSQYNPNFECYDERFIREHGENFTQAVTA